MLYHLFYPLWPYVHFFNIFRYITFRAGGAMLTALFISLVIGPGCIRKLKEHRLQQPIRPDGPESHFAKAGTPTMGGLIILIALVVSTLLWARLDNRFIRLIILATLWLGGLGIIDDWLKLTRAKAKGLTPGYKLLGQMILALFICAYLWQYPSNPEYAGQVMVPYLKSTFVNLGCWYIPFVILIILGSSNAVNLTDGLDGLAIGSIIIGSLPYIIFAYLAGHAVFSGYLKLVPVAGAGELSIFLAAMIGAGLGFLWFNSHPAEVFMGDTASLFLGGTIGIVAVLVRQELLLIIVAGIFIAEVLSVLLQVVSFRIKKKRIFKMAPLHHHFELKGWAESKVVVRFWIIEIVLAMIALAALKIR